MPASASDGARLTLRIAAGALLMLAAASLFGIVAGAVVSGHRITVLDVEIARWLREAATPLLTTWMLIVTHLHSALAVTVYAAVVAAHAARHRRWRRLVTVVVCIGGGLALNVLMKHAFQRARPILDDPLLTLSTYSFPSGHVLGSTLLYGLAVVFVFRRTRRPSLRALAVLGAGAAIALVAFTRLYLGVHYLSDVIAGFLEGVAWLALCLNALAAFWKRRGRTAGRRTAAAAR
ncbi:MAG TPA: phosphatase PAP2 family protein [Caldimonas sp.]|jgi:undecaprenyl-diphosphatase|nr:phosphatase PAP2 family protein [Caldimonas sp.]HEX2541913.1 phosphatase PAP2 family protein [Caldimonas sp.]